MNVTIQLDQLTLFNADRNVALCVKAHGGGLCVYINTEWHKNFVSSKGLLLICRMLTLTNYSLPQKILTMQIGAP